MLQESKPKRHLVDHRESVQDRLRFFGRGGDDVIDARDDVRDFSIQCARGRRPTGRALRDSFDPTPEACAITRNGRPVPGLNG